MPEQLGLYLTVPDIVDCTGCRWKSNDEKRCNYPQFLRYDYGKKDCAMRKAKKCKD